MTITTPLRRILVAGLIVLLTLLLGGTAVLDDARERHLRVVDEAGIKFRHAMEPDPINPDWITSGSPTCAKLDFARSYDRNARSGFWRCDGPASFEWHYGVDESIYILDGRAEIEYLGNQIVLEAGDSFRFAYGTSAHWKVDGFVHKTYLINSPGIIDRAWMKLLRAWARVGSEERVRSE